MNLPSLANCCLGMWILKWPRLLRISRTVHTNSWKIALPGQRIDRGRIGSMMESERAGRLKDSLGIVPMM